MDLGSSLCKLLRKLKQSTKRLTLGPQGLILQSDPDEYGSISRSGAIGMIDVRVLSATLRHQPG
jgi:hypothetical protein